MFLAGYIYSLFLSIIFCWVAFGLIVVHIDPFKAPAWAFIFFFTSLFLALTATATLINFYLRVYLLKRETIYTNLGIAFRQGLFLSMTICSLLGMQALRVLTWWDAVLLILSILLLELYFGAK